MQRRIRLLRLKAGGSVDAQTGLVLTSIAGNPNASLKELAESLAIDPGNFSRLLKKLSTERYLRITPSKFDRRRKEISFSELGLQTVQASLGISQYIAEIGMFPLSDKERTEVGGLFAKVSEGFKAPPEKYIGQEEYFVKEQRRLARALGMHGSNYLGTGYDIETYQLLVLLSKHPNGLKFSDLVPQLPIQRTSLSRLIDRLAEKKILKKYQGEEDRRTIYNRFTANGENKFSSIHDRATSNIENSLRAVSSNQIERLIVLLRRPRLERARTEERAENNWIKVVSEQEYFEARRYLVEQLVKRSAHTKLGMLLLPPSSECWIGYVSGKISALVAGSKKKGILLVDTCEISVDLSDTDRAKLISNFNHVIKSITPKVQIDSKIQSHTKELFAE
jgi:DNA-binding MarR family transcriptional regulator